MTRVRVSRETCAVNHIFHPHDTQTQVTQNRLFFGRGEANTTHTHTRRHEITRDTEWFQRKN